MKFEEITDRKLLQPGEMIFHIPTQSIVIYAALVEDTVRAFTNGTLLEDELPNFKKIIISRKNEGLQSQYGRKGVVVIKMTNEDKINNFVSSSYKFSKIKRIN